MADSMLTWCKAVDRRIWPDQHPLRQFETVLRPELLMKLEERQCWMDQLYDMEDREIGSMVSGSSRVSWHSM